MKQVKRYLRQRILHEPYCTIESEYDVTLCYNLKQKTKAMTAFISAGHKSQRIKVDPGAVANGLTEANLAVEFRNLVVTELLKRVK
jgi:N-acetylmuramoyl-L-alanine amidase